MSKNDDWIRVTTKEEYLAKCADVYFGEDAGRSVATADGRIMGRFGGQELSGTWEWTDEYFCRTSTLGDMDLGHDCLVIEINATQMRLTMEKGEGPVVVYDRKDGPAASENITIMSSFAIKGEQVDDFIAAMKDNQAHVREESGNLEMRLFQSLATPGEFFVFGRTDGAIGLDSHLQETGDRGIEAQVAPTLAAQPVTMTLAETHPPAEYRATGIEPGADELAVIAVFDLQPGTREQLLAQYEIQVPLVRRSEANLVFNVYTVEEDADRVVVHERWTSEAAAGDFSTGQPESVKTGELLATLVRGDLADAIRAVREIDSY